LLWESIAVHWGGEIGAYTTQPNFRIWEMLGALPRTRYSEEVLYYVVGRNCEKSSGQYLGLIVMSN
jgi:hypothetical protein